MRKSGLRFARNGPDIEHQIQYLMPVISVEKI
jgi:hypothetical protein